MAQDTIVLISTSCQRRRDTNGRETCHIFADKLPQHFRAVVCTLKRFKKIYIEISNICNLRCNFCPGTRRSQEMMDEARFGRTITSIHPYTDHVYFHLMGEPLLHPRLARFLEICHEIGLRVNITTNGTLLEQAQSVLLNSPALRQVNISLASFEANSVTKSLENYLLKVTAFVKMAHEHSAIICAIRLWNMDSVLIKGNNKFNEQILQLLETHLEMGEGALALLSAENPSVKVKERLFLHLAERFAWPDMENGTGNSNIFCHGLRDQVGILVDGTVVPCCLDSDGNIPLGNILETPLEDIVHSERALALFNGFSRRRAVETLCQKCGYACRY